MTSKNQMVYLVSVLVLAVLLIASVSAFGHITSIKVSDVETLGGSKVSVFAGETVPVRVVFTATGSASDVRVKAWLSGSRDYSVATERFDVIANNTYSRLLTIQVPSTLDPSEDLTLFVDVESKNNGIADSATVTLGGERESYLLDFLDVNMDPQAKAGSTLAADIVIKNRGGHQAEDTFVRASIPALGIETRGYFSDLSAVDQSDPDKSDAAERKLYLKIPSNAPAGIYVVEFEAFNADSSTTVTKKVAIVGAGMDTTVASPTTSKTFAPGEKATYSITLVNTGSNVRVYNLVVDAPTGLTVNLDQSLVAVQAGSSQTVKMDVSAKKAGEYPFSVTVNSDSEIVKTQDFNANVEGASSGVSGSDTTVILTIVLAVIFVVLLVVLIVLLTRKPEKKEEFGESYY